MAKPSRIGKVHLGGLDIPVHFFFENRRNSRVSLGKHAVLVRLPFYKRGPLLKKDMLWVKNWLEKTYTQKPDPFIRLARQHGQHLDGETIDLYDRSIPLSVHHHADDVVKAQWQKEGILLYMPENTPRHESARVISKLVAQRYRPYLVQRVHQWNDSYFQKDIQSVRLKYNSSNWGSCSTNNIINLSTRLLLTPEPVQDYVVVHELAHLVEMNHSPHFWNVVEKVMPNYEQYERWLNEKGALVDF